MHPNSQKPFNLYPAERLPPSFKYPEAFLKMTGGSYPNIYPWWFIDALTPAGELSYRNRVEAGTNLIPFAKTDLDDDIACFDANDTAGNPAIVMITSTPDRAYGFKDFNSWYAQVQRDVAKVESWRA